VERSGEERIGLEWSGMEWIGMEWFYLLIKYGEMNND